MSGKPCIGCCNGMDPSCDGLDVCAARAWTEVERLTDELQQVANEIALAESQEARRER